MSFSRAIADVGRILRAAVAPLLTLGVLLVVGEVMAGAWVKAFELARPVAVILAGLWLLTALLWAALRPKGDAHAHQRLQELRSGAQAPRRALVYVQTSVWSSSAGQHAVVVSVATCHIHRLWLPEIHMPIGSYALLEQREAGVVVVDWVGQRTVEAGQRHERRHPEHRDSSVQLRASVADPVDRDDARQLIEETEQFLKWQG